MGRIKYLFFLNAFVLLSQFSVCAANDYVIVGKIGVWPNNKQLMLFKFKEENVSDVDTVFINEGRFEFKGHIDKPVFAIISCGNYPDKVYSTRLMVESGTIYVNLDSTSSNIGGTPLNDVYQKYLSERAIVKDSMKQVMAQSKIQGANIEKLQRKYYHLFDRRALLNKDFIIRNSSNEMGIALLKEMLGTLSFNDFLEIYAKSDIRLKSDPTVKKYVPYFEEEYRKDQEKTATRIRIISKPYIDFTAFNPQAKKVRLSDLINKNHYTLLVFWASWCGPCMAEQPTIKKLFEKYHDKGVDVIGISLDSNESAWKQAMTKIESTWPQIRAQDVQSKSLYDAYGFSGIPCNVLIGKDGTVVETNVPKEVIHVYIDALLKSK